MALTPSRMLEDGDVALAIYEWGRAGNRPTVILVHGYPDAASVWTATAESILAKVARARAKLEQRVS